MTGEYIMASVGDRIREIRESKGMNQDRLADKAQISKGFLSDIENGKRNPSSDNLLRIANVLGASLDYLMKGEVQEEEQTRTVQIPPELSMAAQQLNLTYSQTIALLDAHRSVIARRSSRKVKGFDVKDWIALHEAIREVFGE
jgi:transcriptional regulator with XRE-family HTH domain